MDFVLRSIGKAMGDQGIKWRGNTFLDLDYADDSSILCKRLGKMNKLSEFKVLEYA